MVTISENLLVFRYIMCVSVGILLGASLFLFIASENCMEKGTMVLGAKTFYCAERYGDTLKDD